MIKVKNLSKSYGSQQVLKDLNLEVHEGQTVVILGRSGVGKSVLLRQIIGIETPDHGIIEIEGKNILTIPRKERLGLTKKMGMLFQGSALFDSMTVGDNVGFYLKQHMKNISEEDLNKRVHEALDMVGLSGIEDKMPSDLSGGMRKRAALARVIAYRPKIILYDEPTTGLDPITSMQINNLIIATKKELQATSIVVTHDLKSAWTIGDYLTLHYNKQLTHFAPKEEFFKIKDPQIQAFFENAAFSEGTFLNDPNKSV